MDYLNLTLPTLEANLALDEALLLEAEEGPLQHVTPLRAGEPAGGPPERIEPRRASRSCALTCAPTVFRTESPAPAAARCLLDTDPFG